MHANEHNATRSIPMNEHTLTNACYLTQLHSSSSSSPLLTPTPPNPFGSNSFGPIFLFLDFCFDLTCLSFPSYLELEVRLSTYVFLSCLSHHGAFLGRERDVSCGADNKLSDLEGGQKVFEQRN